MKLLLWLPVVLATVVVAEELPDKSEYLVRGLDEVEPAYSEFNGQMYAGRIPFDSSPDRQGKLMFWLFLPDAPTSEDSLVMWLNGGPGCSSFGAGVTFENSPVMVPHRPAGYCCTSPNEKMAFNPFSWTNVAPMLYIEQPGGVGFSEGPEPQVEDDLSRDMHSFLENFFDIFDNLRAKDFYIFGESYAGMFAPSIARRIHLENKNKNDYERINLVGLALGNGWIDTKTQGPAMIDYAWWHGMIDASTKDALHQQFEKCLDGKPSVPPLHSLTTPDECGIMEAVLASAGAGLMADRAPNTYDVTTFDTYPMLDSNNPNTTIMKFFNNERVRKALNAPTTTSGEWRGCIPGAGRRRRRLALLDNDRPQSIAPYLAELMDDGHVRVLIYNGDRDLSCNVAGSETVLNKMTEWSAHDEWLTAPRGMWLDDTDNEMAGWAKEYNRLALVAVYNSGHLVPFNQPGRSQQLLHNFVTNTSFINVQIPRLFLPEDATTTNDVTRSSSWIVGLVGLVAGIGIGWMAARNNRRTSYAPVQSS